MVQHHETGGVKCNEFLQCKKIRVERVGLICRFLALFSRDKFAMQKSVSVISAVTVIYESQHPPF